MNYFLPVLLLLSFCLLCSSFPHGGNHMWGMGHGSRGGRGGYGYGGYGYGGYGYGGYGRGGGYGRRSPWHGNQGQFGQGGYGGGGVGPRYQHPNGGGWLPQNQGNDSPYWKNGQPCWMQGLNADGTPPCWKNGKPWWQQGQTPAEFAGNSGRSASDKDPDAGATGEFPSVIDNEDATKEPITISSDDL